MMSVKRFSGIIPPMVTPLRARDELDVAGLERLIEHLVAGGVHGVFILGTTGEGPSLGYRLRRELIERTCRQIAKRIPVLVGISDTALSESFALAHHAADCGADGVVAAAPYYLPPNQPELRAWMGQLASELPLPLMLYDMPALTKVSLDFETVRRAMDFETIVGIKESSGDLERYQAVVSLATARGDWTVLMGQENELAAAITAGGHGGVPGGANIFPRLYVELYEAATARDSARADELQRIVLSISHDLYRAGESATHFIKAIKGALSCLRICDSFPAAPLLPLNATERAVVERTVHELRPRWSAREQSPQVRP